VRRAATLASWGVGAALALTLALEPSAAEACGGCFVPPETNTLVTGHRMLVSIASDATTLVDQITYSGEPASFAWILPTKGLVEVGLSSDLVFATLESQTDPRVSAPPLNCPASQCLRASATGGDFENGAGGGSNGGVSVLAQEVVGPYATVQLSADEPEALRTWLEDNGYALPADVEPVVDAYVAEGWSFLALKLVPGAGIAAMRPVRVTTPGASVALPLRMVAAGTGPVTPITVYVLGEGRYEPANFPSFSVDPSAVSWRWESSSSNYVELLQAGFAADARAFATIAAMPEWSLESTLRSTVTYSPAESGYGDGSAASAEGELEADLEALLGGLDPESRWVTRLQAALPRSALDVDLELQASPGQQEVSPFVQATSAVGTPPPCPADPCVPRPLGRCAVGLDDGREPSDLTRLALGLVGLATLAGLSRRRGARARSA
jgi:hypothetical protein